LAATENDMMLRLYLVRHGETAWSLSGHGRSDLPLTARGEVAARAERLIVRLGGVNGNVALFSHGQFSRVLAAQWIGLIVAYWQHFALGTATLG
jgi:broad specificity phosphatase PhoE